jgi:hypothetical protein
MGILQILDIVSMPNLIVISGKTYSARDGLLVKHMLCYPNAHVAYFSNKSQIWAWLVLSI